MRICSLLFLYLLCITATLKAQISSSTHLQWENAPYQSAPQDVVYYFGNNNEISLKAQAISLTGNLTFNWRKYNASTGNWDNFLSTTGTESNLPAISQGGYEVSISDGSTTETYRAWTLVPQLSGTPLVEVSSHNCSFLTLKTTGINVTPLMVVNPSNGNSISINYGLSFRWLGNGTMVKEGTTATESLDAPYEDTDYEVEVTSRFTFTDKLQSLPVNVISQAVEAKFEHKITKPDVPNEITTDVKGSSPLRLSFFASPDGTENRSRGKITAYTWEFGGIGKDYVPNPSFVFLNAGTYPVTVTVENTVSGCTSTSDVVSFVVDNLFVDAPNFFTPTGDGIHDEFRVAYRSVKKFRMVITNRWGRVVYETTNPAEGWDGTIGGNKAAPGVYYYDVVAEGFNKGEHKHLKGFLHLIRTEK